MGTETKEYTRQNETTDVISTKSYLISILIGTIPLVGDIFLFKWGKDTEVRINKQNLCLAYLILKLTILYQISALISIVSYLFS